MTGNFLISFFLLFVWQTSPSFQVRADEFCPTCQVASNTNCHFSGTGNRGFVLSNTGTTVSASNCDFNLRSNTGSIFNGNNNNWDATSNTGTTVRGSGNTMQLRSNIDSNIQAESANLIALSNTRLKVTGSNFRTEIKDTTDHVFHGGARKKRDVGNQLEISPRINHRLNKREISTDGTPEVIIHFIDDAVVDGCNYKIGKFSFTLNPADNGSYEMRMINETVANGLMKQRMLNEKVALLTVNRDGLEHNLKVKGALVTSSPDQTLTLFSNHPDDI